MAADGSIIIETLLDDKEAKKELTKLNNRITTLNNQIYTNQRLKMPLVEQSKQAAANLDLAMASLEKMKSASTYGIAVGLPFNNPMPNQLPLPMANSDCVI